MTRNRLLNKLLAIADSQPDVNLGALLEAVEGKAWDSLPQRHCSARLMHMADDLLERGCDLWMAERGVKTTGWLS